MKSHFFAFLQLVVFCIVLTVGFDTERLVVMPPLTVYADQISEVEEAEAFDENSDSDSESDNTDNENDEENSDDSADEAKDSNMDSNDTTNSDADSNTKEDTNSESEDKSEDISEDTNTAVGSEPEEVKSNVDDKAEQFELSDKTGHIESIRFSRPERKTEAPTEAETVEHTEPETELETEPETQEETTQEETTQEETAPESVADTQPETKPETETVAETEAVKEVPAKSHTTHGGGITTYDNSEMDYINNPETPVVVVEEVIPEPKAIEVQQPVVTVTEHRSTPKTGESDDLYLLAACILFLFALILNAPSFYGKTGTTLSKEVKSINREDSIKALGVTATRANCRTRRSRRMQKRALAFLAFGQTR